ncbi:MAG: hypothetical protein ISS77_01435 [Phycisphaerae bacterium]|nr:hypothetical protein [Phycisphaerae bacterium]
MEANVDWEGMPGGKLKAIGVVVLIVVVGLAILIFSSVVKIDGDEVGIVEKKLLGGDLPRGSIIATKGENGIQAQVLAPGWHVKWKWQYNVIQQKMVEIEQGFVGLVLAMDGRSLPEGVIYAPQWENEDEMKNAEYFLTEGNGYKGPQLTVLDPGKYRINTKLFKITKVPLVNVKVGTVAIVKSNVGEVVDAKDRLVEVGQRGIWNKPWKEGKYYKNTNAYEITMVSVQQVKVSYSAEREQGEKAAIQPMKPIIVRSEDGYTFPVEVRVIYKIEAENAPKVVATIGDDDLVLSKLVTPTVQAIFRNNAGEVKALEYVQNRGEQETQSTAMLKEKLAKDGITILAVHIGDVGDEKTLGALLKTQTDREIALQEQTTLQVQQQAAEQRKALFKTQQEAQEEMKLATAAYAVKIADEEKKKVIIAAEAEAQQIKLIAEAQAKAYELISGVIGADNAALVEIIKLVAEKGIDITPEVMVGGDGSGMSDALMGTILSGKLGTNEKTK